MADAHKALLHVKRTLSEGPRRTYQGNEQAAKHALCTRPLFHSADFPGHGRRRQRRRDKARDVRDQSGRVRGLQFQTAEFRGIEARFSVAHDMPSARARADRRVQPLLMIRKVLIVRVHPEILRCQGLPDESCSMRKPCGKDGSVQSWIWRNIFIETAPDASNFFSIYQRTSSGNASSNGLIIPTKTGK